MNNRESFGSNQAYNQQRAAQGMTPEEACFRMNLIHRYTDANFDGSWPSLLPTIGLLKALLETPELFWETYFAEMGTEHDKERSAKVAEFIARPEFDAHSYEQMKTFVRTI